MPYSKQKEVDLIQLYKHDRMTVSMMRMEESEHGLKKVSVYTVELLDDAQTKHQEESVFISKDSNIGRAFYIYDTIKRAVLVGRCS